MAAIQAVFRHGSISSSGDGGILCLCIGDGCTPRTALLMAFLAKQSDGWECVSIDPELSEEWAMGGGKANYDGFSTRGVRGLHCYKGTLKEFLLDTNRPPSILGNNPPTQRRRWRHLVLVCVHSHARFIEEASIENIRVLYSCQASDDVAEATASPSKTMEESTTLLPTTIVSLPCCPTFKHVGDIGQQPTLKYDDDCVFSACRSVEVWNLVEETYSSDTIKGSSMATNAYCSEQLTFLQTGGNNNC